MSNRTLIEINHDCAHELRTPGFLDALGLYINSASPETREALEQFGVRVFGMRHHSEGFSVRWGTHATPIEEQDSETRRARDLEDLRRHGRGR